MAPVKTAFGNTAGIVTEKHLNFYKARNEYIGAVIPEPFYIDKGLRELPTQIGIDTDEKITGLKKLAEVIHEKGAKAIAHLNHPGRMVNPKIPNNYFVSSTNKACNNVGIVPSQLDVKGLEKVKSLFVNAAIRAEKANFDFIELQFGHGYLFAQFLSPVINDREDSFGGSFENRMKFPLEVLQAIKRNTSLKIIARISADEMTPEGVKLPEMKVFSKILKEEGVSALHVSAGSICSTPPWYFQHMFVPKGKLWQLADAIREVVDIPVIYVGQINEFENLTHILNKSENTYVAIGRALVADPNFVAKYLGIDRTLLRPCLACSDGCLGGVKSGKGLGCTVNPLVGREDFRLNKVSKPRKVAVIGGGLAGMTAAVVLQKRNYKVSLFEKEELGGQFNLASLPPHKNSLQKLVAYMKEDVKNEGVNVHYDEANIDLLNTYDEVVIATGSKPKIINFKGLDKYALTDILEAENTPKNKRVVVIGGGLIGTEIALKLLENNNRVFLIEITDSIAKDMEMIERKLILKSFSEKDIEVYTNTSLQRVVKKDVYIQTDNKETCLCDMDQIVLATGMQPNLPDFIEKLDKPFHLIGDAKNIGKAQDAIRDAFDIASTL